MLSIPMNAEEVSFGNGKMKVTTVAKNAVRVQYMPQLDTDQRREELPDWLYVKHDKVTDGQLSVDINAAQEKVTVKDKAGRPVFVATRHELENGTATMAWVSPKDERLYGLGQFQESPNLSEITTSRRCRLNEETSFLQERIKQAARPKAVLPVLLLGFYYL